MVKYLRDGRAPIPRSETTSKVMSANKGKDTKPEIRLRKALWSNGLRGYRLHWKKVPGRPDISYPSRKIAIFVNGCFWHRCPKCKLPLPGSNKEFWKEKFRKNRNRDKKKKKELEKSDWIVITLWECDIQKNLDMIIKAIKKTYMKQID